MHSRLHYQSADAIMPQKTADATQSPLHQRAVLGLRDLARIKRGNDALVRVCMIAFGVAIAAIAPVTWGWKIALFLVIMALVGMVMPAISRARRYPY